MPELADTIEESLAAVAEKAGDPAPAVYANLFRRWPELEPLFIRDTRGDVRGEMFTKTLECVLDLVGPNAYATNFIASEIVNHDGVGVPADVFPRFFEVTVQTFAELLGPDWTPAFAAAWREVLGRIASVTAEAVHAA